MREANRLLMLGAMALAFSIVGCDCGGSKPPEEIPDAGPGTDGGVDIPDAGPGSQCLAQGAACSRTSGNQCCTGVCGTDNRCPEPNQLCKSPGETCQAGGECCTNVCDNGKCASNLCRDVGQTCTGAEQCCTKTCTNGTCAEIPGSTSSCKVLGQACASGAECCSTNCQGGLCTRAYTCKAYGDVCLSNAECCGNSCSSTDGTTAGRCLFVTGGGGGGCRQDGNPCSDGSTCCSRTCVDLGYGAKVCQPVGGCKLTGNFCSVANDCCGGGTNPNGSVHCTGGRCDNGQSCNGVGNICGARLGDGGIVDVNASQNCCDGRKEVCKLDESGVPRCFGGGSTQCPTGYTGTAPCCISDGQNCQFSDQCCGEALCLPNGSGGLTCQRPTCSPLGSTCDPASPTCCAGTSCLPVGELAYACQQPTSGGGGGTDGGTDGGTGTPDAGPTCRANETSCTSPSQCCSGICTGSLCKPPALCQPQNGACTSGADCCQGLRCEVPAGATTGTCQPGATCSAGGQACSPTTPCCSGLACEGINSGAVCNGTEPCICAVIIG